jgi:hypothetical protein
MYNNFVFQRTMDFGNCSWWMPTRFSFSLMSLIWFSVCLWNVCVCRFYKVLFYYICFQDFVICLFHWPLKKVYCIFNCDVDVVNECLIVILVGKLKMKSVQGVNIFKEKWLVWQEKIAVWIFKFWTT